MLLGLALASVLLAAPDSAAGARNAEEIAQEVKAHEEALSKLREQATSVVDALAAAEEQARALEAAAQKAEAGARQASARVEAAQRDEEASRKALIAQLGLLAPRLKARYRLGKDQRAGLIFDAPSLGDLLWRRRALDRVLEGDLALLGRARDALAALETHRATLQAAKAELAGQSQTAKEKRSLAAQRHAELASLHGALLEEQDLREKTLRELYRVQADLSRFVEELPEAAAPARASLVARKGRMPFPVQGLIEVGFGKVLNPRFNTVTFQKGLDIRAPLGSPVAAVGAGKVVHAGPFRGYGNLVIIDHGEGYHSLYAHLEELSKGVGDEVKEGDRLGTVGETGSLKGAYLYFEIREKGKPVDPKSWLAPPR